ncbi:hypothetical protein BDV93DRAFT_521186, partial [Ceratobasidium sp. AG-I]
MLEQDSLLAILSRLQSPTHGAPSSQLQLAAMRHSDSPPDQFSVEFDTLKSTHASILLSTLEQLDADAAALLALHEMLQHRRKQGQDFYNRAAAVLAPINRVPAEVLARIFVSGKHLELNFAPRMSWVARRWRNIALSTPELWNAIPLTSATRVSVYLERSGSTLLDIQVDLRTYRISWYDILVSMKTLEPHRHRWRNMKVLLEDHEQAQPILRRLERLCDPDSGETHSNHLKGLYFGVSPSDVITSSIRSSYLKICAIPTLQVVEMFRVDLLYFSSPGPTTFQRLRRLSLSGTQNMHLETHLFNSLNAMPNLVELVLDQCEFLMPGPIEDSPPILLEKLTTLQLFYVPDEVSNLIFTRVNAPNALRLEIVTQTLDGPSQVLNWETLLNKFHKLSTLKLDGITTYATGFLLRWLEQLPKLLSLTAVFRENLSPRNVTKSSKQILQQLADPKRRCCATLHTLRIGELRDDGVTQLRAVVEIRPLLRAGRVTAVLQQDIDETTKHRNTLSWLSANISDFRTCASDVDDYNSSSSDESEEEF